MEHDKFKDIKDIKDIKDSKDTVLRERAFLNDDEFNDYGLTAIADFVNSLKNWSNGNMERSAAKEPVHPDYYKGDNKDGKSIEVFDIIDQFVEGDFYLGNVLKYVCRAGKKSKETKKQDLEKAAHYIMEAIKRLD